MKHFHQPRVKVIIPARAEQDKPNLEDTHNDNNNQEQKNNILPFS